MTEIATRGKKRVATKNPDRHKDNSFIRVRITKQEKEMFALYCESRQSSMNKVLKEYIFSLLK